MNSGESMINLAKDLWPLGRSISGEGVRKTLKRIQQEIPSLELKQFHTGERYSDWIIPKEWNVKQAYLISPNGDKICDYSVNNLHLVGYSIPTKKTLTLNELQDHLYSLPEQPKAIPYVTSYYKENWGFCLSQEQRDQLENGMYQVHIDTSLDAGDLDYAEVVVAGESNREIFFSTYICHPSMANNELSGPVLATEILKKITQNKNYYTYRFVFIPETIGSIAYLNKHLNVLKERVIAGFVLTCVGDDRTYSYLPSRQGDTVADRFALATLVKLNIRAKMYSWHDRGSDERQYCAPGVDLPVCSVMRSKYWEYPEYHTSLDQIGSVVTAEGLEGSFHFYEKLIEELEKSRFPKIQTLGEPQLGRRGLYPNTSIKGAYDETRTMMNVISNLDGLNSISEIAAMSNTSEINVENICKMLENEGLITQ